MPQYRNDSEDAFSRLQGRVENGFYDVHSTHSGRYDKFLPAVKKKLDPGWRNHVSILDVGSSYGNAVNDFVRSLEHSYADTTFDVTAVDPGKDYAENSANQSHVDWGLQADGKRLPFADDSFDLVVTHRYVPFVRTEDQSAALTELERVLASDGVAAFDLPTGYEACDENIAHYTVHDSELQSILDDTDRLEQRPVPTRSKYLARSYLPRGMEEDEIEKLLAK